MYVCISQFTAVVTITSTFPLLVHSGVKELARLFSACPTSSRFSLTYLLVRRTSRDGIKNQMLLSVWVFLLSTHIFIVVIWVLNIVYTWTDYVYYEAIWYI